MSVVAANPSETKTKPLSLWFASLIGGIYLLAALAIVFYGVPELWRIGMSNWLEPALGNFVDRAFLIIAMIAAAIILVIFGMSLAGPHPQRGLRGGIFLAIAAIFIAFFLVRALLMIFERMSTKFELPQTFSLLIVGLLAFLFYKFINSDRLPRWAETLDAAGWFEARAYKRTQGVKVRRLTILGVLLLLGTGIYTLLHNNVIGHHHWNVSLPFSNGAFITLLPDAHITVPLILIALSLWFAWRLVNYPVFADFLIATEAEINKVSWTPRARLIQDTIVVLVTVFIITMFLFIVDVFWGWILSRDLIGVLPGEADKIVQPKQLNTNEW